MMHKLNIGGHETFYPRDRWFYKGIKYLEAVKDDHSDEYPTDKLGVGINMVKSIRYWLRAADIIDESSSPPTVSVWVKRILEYDPYLDSPVTMWLIHNRLITGDRGPSVWKWFFSESGPVNFTKDHWIAKLSDHLKSQYGKAVSEKSLQKEFSVLTGMYCNNIKKDYFYPSPFTFMNLITYNPHLNVFKRNRSTDIPSEVLFYLIYNFRNSFFPDSVSVDTERLYKMNYSPLRIFLLDNEDLHEKYDSLSGLFRKYFNLSRSSGMGILTIKQAEEEEMLREMYKTTEVSLMLS